MHVKPKHLSRALVAKPLSKNLQYKVVVVGILPTLTSKGVIIKDVERIAKQAHDLPAIVQGKGKGKMVASQFFISGWFL